jgi:hypothetical protein
MNSVPSLAIIGFFAVLSAAPALRCDPVSPPGVVRVAMQQKAHFRGTLGPFEARLHNMNHSSKRMVVRTQRGLVQFIITPATTFVVDNARAGSEYDLREGVALGIDWSQDAGSEPIAEHVRIFTH